MEHPFTRDEVQKAMKGVCLGFFMYAKKAGMTKEDAVMMYRIAFCHAPKEMIIEATAEWENLKPAKATPAKTMRRTFP